MTRTILDLIQEISKQKKTMADILIACAKKKEVSFKEAGVLEFIATEERQSAEALMEYTEDQEAQISANRWYKEVPETKPLWDAQHLNESQLLDPDHHIDKKEILSTISEQHNLIINLLDRLINCTPSERVTEFLDSLKRTEKAHIRKLMTSAQIYEDT